MRATIPPRPMYAFDAQYYGDSAAYEEFDTFLREEFAKRPPGWEPTFGRVTRFDRDVKACDYAYLLSGNVPAATSKTEAETRSRRLVAGLGQRFRLAHPNPGNTLPAPLIRVWKW